MVAEMVRADLTIRVSICSYGGFPQYLCRYRPVIFLKCSTRLTALALILIYCSSNMAYCLSSHLLFLPGILSRPHVSDIQSYPLKQNKTNSFFSFGRLSSRHQLPVPARQVPSGEDPKSKCWGSECEGTAATAATSQQRSPAGLTRRSATGLTRRWKPYDYAGWARI